MFAKSDIKGNLPKERQRVNIVKICAEIVTDNIFERNGSLRKDKSFPRGSAKSKIPNTAENESIKPNEKAEKGFISKIINAAKDKEVSPS